MLSLRTTGNKYFDVPLIAHRHHRAIASDGLYAGAHTSAMLPELLE